MKSMTSLFIVNALIIIFLILSLWYKISLIPLFILLPVNILLIYIKSTALDKNEQKKKIMLHKVKNSLSVIMGYSEAHSDELITKEEFDLSIFLRFFHVLAEKNTISGTNSSLPNNIENDKITFVKSGIVEKLLIGPK